MLRLNILPLHGAALDPRDAETLSVAGADIVQRHLAARPDHAPTPLLSLPGLAREIAVGALLVKDEGQRLGLGSFKALGGAYAVARLVLEEAGRSLGRDLDATDLADPAVRAVAAGMTFACATDGNHGRSVAQGAAQVGARSFVFVHGGVSAARVAAIAAFGAEIVRVAGTYDESVVEAASVARARGWTIVSDTSWPGYERIPGLVMQGYTALLREALAQGREAPTHVFIQAGVGGIAATLAGHLAILFGAARPRLVVVEPDRAACLLASLEAGGPTKVGHGEPTVMAMLECYEPSLVAWRILARAADAFMTVADEEAVAAMGRLARPVAGDPVVVAGESGGAGLAGLLQVARDPAARDALGIGPGSRILLVNTEGATDPERFRELVGLDPAALRGGGPTATGRAESLRPSSNPSAPASLVRQGRDGDGFMATTPVILVVDDEALLRMLAADFFSDAGYEVIEAANGEEALDALRSRPDIAAVVTDVHMPGRPDGFALSRMVRAQSEDCAIVVVSGRAAPNPGDLAEGARYVPKPFQGPEVVRIVTEMLSGEA